MVHRVTVHAALEKDPDLALTLTSGGLQLSLTPVPVDRETPMRVQ